MVGDKDAAALAGELTGDAGASLNGFFDHTGLDAAMVGGGGQGEGEEEEELEWLSNKDAFPSVDTMAAEVEAAAAAPARAAVGPRTKGLRRRRRVTAPWSLPPPLLSRPRLAPAPAPAADAAAPRRRCTHCAVEDTPQWRLGPDGPRTLCNACGVRFKSGRLFPEYRPANSPTFSPLLHSNSHRRVMEMRRESEEDASAAIRVNAKARRAERAAARSAGKGNK
ncbi:GATA transcription factor 3-like [Oryza brachyantha]|uniref:GATA transcription factor 3-like n=1 Tax=Oryza brachyantha TaxID=4533 RepID=UPI001ADB1CB9|nr:GATA transcription factor 3-like [Oryza brachyantha]